MRRNYQAYTVQAAGEVTLRVTARSLAGLIEFLSMVDSRREEERDIYPVRRTDDDFVEGRQIALDMRVLDDQADPFVLIVDHRSAEVLLGLAIRHGCDEFSMKPWKRGDQR